MLMKVFEYGKGRGELATDYLVKEDYANRHTPPSVLRGDHKLTTDLINSLDTVWKYTSGVLSWHPDDEVSEEQEQALMNDFERLAFAGLEPDQYNILWVRHSHAGHHELHFVIPRMELSTGKAFNPCPPNWRNHFDPLRNFYNIKENWARPDDPKRARLYTPEHADIKYNRLKRQGKEIVQTETDKIREFLLDYMIKRIENGLIKNRADIIASLEGLDFKINRQGKTYISVQDTENKHKIRFKGGIFNEHWRLATEGTAETRSGQNTDGASPTAELERLTRELTEIHAKRSAYNRGRYRSSKAKIQHANENELENLFLPHDMLNLSHTGDIPIWGGRVSLSDNEYQHLEERRRNTRERNSNSSNDARAAEYMGDRTTKQREREFYTTPTWGEARHKGTMDVQSQEWDTTRHKARKGIETSDIMDMIEKTDNNTITKESYERDTKISTEIIYPTRTNTFENTESAFPSPTGTNDTNAEYQEQTEYLEQSMLKTSRTIAKLEHGIQELRTLIERFKEYLGAKIKQRAKTEEAEKEITQEAKITTQTTAPRRWRI